MGNGINCSSKSPVCFDGIYSIVIRHIDIDECAIGTHDCHRDSNATCNDTDGSFTCTCSEGFDGNGTFCEGTLYIGTFCLQ